jgi:glutamate-1-semialdehyde 2,1-aminomutase
MILYENMDTLNLSSRLIGGVNSPVRACQAVAANPFYAKKAEGAYLYDEKGDAYIDYICGFGPILLGHRAQKINQLLVDSANYSALGVCHAAEETLAQSIHAFMPAIEKIRFTNSGGEAAGVAVRLAKAYTQKTQIIKFVGQYHGAVDSVLGYTAQSSLDRHGIDASIANNLVCLPFNDAEALNTYVTQHHDKVAGIMVELISGNMGYVPGQQNFIDTIASLCKQFNIVFIADEVMTGFRVHEQGASFLYNVKPDLTLLGKVIGGGFPIGAVGGHADIMNLLSPVGEVYHAGTFAGHPLAMQAGNLVLNAIKTDKLLAKCEHYIATLCVGLKEIFNKKGIPFTVDHGKAMFGFFFQAEHPKQFSDITAEHSATFNQFYHHCRNLGVLLPPSAFEAIFVTGSHDQHCLNRTLEVAESAF